MTTINYAIRRRCYLFMLNKLGLPRSFVSPLVKNVARALNPIQLFRRKHKANTIGNSTIEIPQRGGFIAFGPDDLPGTEKLVSECRKIFKQTQSNGDIDRRTPTTSKAFLVPASSGSKALMDNSSVRKFVLSDAVLAQVIKYFGSVPILSMIDLFYSPINDTKTKSQKYHFDTEDYRQLKIFVNIFDVTPETGPFTFIDAELSSMVKNSTGYVGGRRTRLEDEPLTELIGEHKPLSLIGPAGSGAIVDTSRCLHFGSRGNTKERLVLFVQFVDYFTPKIIPADWTELADKHSGELDEVRKLILRC